MHYLNRLTGWLEVKILTLLMVVLLVLSLYVILLDNLVLDELPRFLPGFEREITKQSGLTVSVGLIEGDMRWLTPVIKLGDIRLQDPYNPGNTLFTIPSVTIEVDVFSSLMHWGVRLEHLRIDGVKLSLLHDSENKWDLQGLASLKQWWSSRQPENDLTKTADAADSVKQQVGRWLPYLYNQRVITLTNWQLDFNDDNRRVNQLKGLDLKLVNAGNNHRLGISGDWQDALSQNLSTEVSVEYQGSSLSLEEFSGEAYLNLPSVDLTHFVAGQKVRDLAVEQVVAGSELWITFEKGQVEAVSGGVQVGQVVIRRDGYESPASVENFSVLFDWRRRLQGWEVTVEDMAFDYKEGQWPSSNFFAFYVQTDDVPVPDEAITFFTDYMDVGAAAQFLLTLPLPEDKLDALASLNPKGSVIHAKAGVTLKGSGDKDIDINAGFNNLGIQAYQKIPGFSGVDGVIEIANDTGWLEVFSEALSVYPATFYSKPISAREFSGSAMWFREDDGSLTISTGLLSLKNDDVQSAAALFNMTGLAKGAVPELGLVATIEGGNVAHTSRYLPDQRLPEGLYLWLKEAIGEGELSEGGFVHNGPIKAPVSEPMAKTFEMQFQVQDVSLAFMPDWPALTDASADVIVDGRELRIYGTQGRLLNTRLTADRIEVPFDVPGDDVSLTLYISAEGAGPVSDGLYILTKTSLGDVVPEPIHNWEGKGQTRLQLELALPLEGSGAPVVSLDAKISDGQLSDPVLDLYLTDINGDAHYDTERWLRADKLTGRWLGHAVESSIGSDPSRDQTLIKVQGSVDIPSLYQWSKNTGLALMDGDMTFQADFHFLPDQAGNPVAGSYLEVRSDLRGVSVRGPEPLKKSVEESVPTVFRLSLGGQVQEFSVGYGERVQAVGWNAGSGPVKASINFGETMPQLKEPFGLWVSGHIAKMNTDEWMSFFDHIEKVNSQLENEETAASPVATRQGQSVKKEGAWYLALAQEGGRDLVDRVQEVQLTIGELQVFDQQLMDIDVVARRGVKNWQLYLDNAVVRGDIRIPDDYGRDGPLPVVADLDYIKLPGSVDADVDVQKLPSAVSSGGGASLAAKNSASAGIGIEPGDVPPLDLNLDLLEVGGEQYGRWKLEVRPDPDNPDAVLFQNLDFTCRKVRFTGHSLWRREGDGYVNQFIGKGSAADIGEVLQAWGYEPNMESKSASVQISAEWPGLPYDVSYTNMTADLGVRMDDAVLLNVDPRTSAIKALGFLSFNNLSRRMRLDFKDIYEEGLELEKVRGDFHLERQLLATQNLTIQAPYVEEIKVRGDTNLATETLNFKMDVTLPVSSSLLPACILGPQVCVGVVVGGALLKSQLDELTTVTYKITGTWDDPTFKES